MNDLAVFNFDNNSITATIYGGKPAFVAVEVAYALGYKDEHQAINKHCKSLIKLDSVETTELGFGFRPKGIILIRESDVYRLVMRSKLESAERFQDWVRRHGKLLVTSSQGRSGGYVYDKDGTYINPKTGEEMYTSKVQLTNAGARKMYREYLKLNLPMKKSWNGEFSNSPFKD